MSEARHTQGPWLHRGKDDAVYTEPPEGSAYTFGQMIFKFDDENSPSDADLALILAAPELLEALMVCKDALVWVVEQGGGPACEHAGSVACFCKENNAISVALETIAKATGRSDA